MRVNGDAVAAEDIGDKKANMAAAPMFLLAVLAGAFVALAAAFSTTVIAGAGETLPFGIVKLIAGITFSIGLILVVLGGAELFTGNNGAGHRGRQGLAPPRAT